MLDCICHRRAENSIILNNYLIIKLKYDLIIKLKYDFGFLAFWLSGILAFMKIRKSYKIKFII